MVGEFGFCSPLTMLLTIYEIPTGGPGRIATMARPAGDSWLPDEMDKLAKHGVTDLVSHLTDMEIYALGLPDEGEVCEAAGMRFHHYPIGDGGLPSRPEYDFFIDSLVPVLRRGGFIVVHCRGGIGRSSITAAALLIRLGMKPGEAVKAIAHARGFPIPDTMEQYDFIMSLAR
jgi:protein-tyrosine phosphatase